MQTFEKSSSPKLLDRISHILHTDSLWVCLIKVCSNGGSTYIISEILVKNILNIANLMQTFENLLLQNYTIEFLDISHK